MPAAIVEPAPASAAGHHNHLDAKTLGLDPSLRTSYPTQSLSFLRGLKGAESSSETSSRPAQAKLKLNIVIAGAGLGGLATSIALARRGHSVIVLEQAPKLDEVHKSMMLATLVDWLFFCCDRMTDKKRVTQVGAGIQIPPNSGRLLRRWGVFAQGEDLFAKPSCINFRRWQDGDLIGYTDLGDFNTRFGAPYCVAHRAHLQRSLHARALELGVEVRLDSLVVAYRPDDAAVELSTGEVVRGDLIVAADGMFHFLSNLDARHPCRVMRALDTMSFDTHSSLQESSQLRETLCSQHRQRSPVLRGLQPTVPQWTRKRSRQILRLRGFWRNQH